MSDVPTSALDLLPYGDLAEIARVGQGYPDISSLPLARDDRALIRTGLVDPNVARFSLLNDFLSLPLDDISLQDEVEAALEGLDGAHRDGRVAHALKIDVLSELIEVSREPGLDPDEGVRRVVLGAESCVIGLQMVYQATWYHRSERSRQKREIAKTAQIMPLLPSAASDRLMAGVVTPQNSIVHEGVAAVTRGWVSDMSRRTRNLTSMYRGNFGSRYPGITNLVDSFAYAAKYSARTALKMADIGDFLMPEWQPPVRHPRQPKPTPEVILPRVIDETSLVAAVNTSPAQPVNSKGLKTNDVNSVIVRGGKINLGKDNVYEFNGFGDNARYAAGFFDHLASLKDDLDVQAEEYEMILGWLADAEQFLSVIGTTSSETRQQLTTQVKVVRCCLENPGLIKVVANHQNTPTAYVRKLTNRLEALRARAAHPSRSS